MAKPSMALRSSWRRQKEPRAACQTKTGNENHMLHVQPQPCPDTFARRLHYQALSETDRVVLLHTSIAGTALTERHQDSQT